MAISSALQGQTDRRQYFLKEKLTNYGFYAILAEDNPELLLEPLLFFPKRQSILILLPIPAPPDLLDTLQKRLTTRHIVLGGNLPKDFLHFCQKNKINVIDYMKLETVAIENAVATAEGALCEACMASDYNLHGSNCLVTGFGKCGEILADKLHGMKANVFISTRNPSEQAKAFSYGYQLHKNYKDYHFIFNSVPALILTSDIINQLKEDVVIIDIASKPGGTDFAYCEKKGICAKLCPGLPGKYAAQTSADIIFDNVIKLIKNIG